LEEFDYMGVSNRKRTTIPEGATSTIKDFEQVSGTTTNNVEPKPERNQPDELQLVSDNELISLRARLESEMRRRNISFSVGDIGEQLVIDHFISTPGLPNLMRAPRGTKNVDALSRDGDRYSIKTIWKAKKTGTVYPDPADKNKQLFEFILIAQLDDQWRIRTINQLTWKDFVSVRSWDKRMNAWYVSCSVRTLRKAQVVMTS
jgi:hypothetical protein